MYCSGNNCYNMPSHSQYTPSFAGYQTRAAYNTLEAMVHDSVAQVSYSSMFDNMIQQAFQSGWNSASSDYSSGLGKLVSDDYGGAAGAAMHEPQVFLRPTKPQAEFVENMSIGLRDSVRNVFRLLMGRDIPQDIMLNVLSKDMFRFEHGRHSNWWSENIQGFAVNRKHMGDISSVFVKSNPLDSLMLTIGHEIGHCMSLSREDSLIEEAKAFAFELAWMQTIYENNIMGLKEHMNMALLMPAKNGLHDTALDIVRNQLNLKSPLAVFYDIVEGNITS